MSGLSQATRGFLGDAAAVVGGIASPTVVVGVNYVDLLYSTSITLSNVGSGLVNWGIRGSVYDIAVLTVTQLNSTTIRVATTNQNTGGLYLLLVPAGAVADVLGTPSGANSPAFTGRGRAPSVILVRPLTRNSLEVTFSEAVVGAEATSAVNYQVGNGLAVTGVIQQSPTTYTLFTTATAPGVVYTLTVGGIHDFAGNLVA